MRNAITALGIGILTLVTGAPAFAQGIHLPGVDVQIGPPDYVPPPPHGYYGHDGYGHRYYPGGPYGGGPQRSWQDPREFSFQVRQRMNRIDSHLRNDVQIGVAWPRALGELQARRVDVEMNLRAASSDGVITWDERQRINDQLQQMQGLDVQYRRNAYGGGPPPWDEYHDWR